jgi:WD40-like Beta Propeller Repeat
VILKLPAGVTNAATPRFSADGQSILFAATPPAGGREEINQIGVDGSNLECVTCGVSTNVAANLFKPVPFQDDSGRILVQTVQANGSYTNAVLEDGPNGKVLVPVISPTPNAETVIDPQREMRPSPDGTHVLFSQIVVGQGGTIMAITVVGTLTRTTNATTGAAEYHIDDSRVVYGNGEGKQWTPDSKGVIVLGGTYEAGNVDDVEVDLATGKVTQVTANPEYDEDIDMSPNEQWIAVGSTRTLDALSPMDRIGLPAFLPAYIQGSVYTAYAGTSNVKNVTNQEWVIAEEDELTGDENGIPLFVDGDGYTARSMPSWNADGTAVTFWEASATDSRLVVANLKYTTSVGPVAEDETTPNPEWAPKLNTYVASNPPLPGTGTYTGAGGGTAMVGEASGATGHTIRTVTYTDYVNEDGMILNGTESTDTTASQASIHYVADITVTGTHTGYLKGDVIINKLTRTITSTDPSNPTPITSDLDGDTQILLDPNNIQEAQANV